MSKPVALVTGGSRGIGAACVKALAKEGYAVAVHYRSGEEEAKAIAAELEGAMPIRADLSDEAACQELVKIVQKEMGGLDCLVNNAGMCIDQLLAFAKPKDFDQLISVNLKPVFLLSKLAARGMLRKKHGRIINISSVVGYTGNAGQSMYAATKSAIVGFTKSIAAELAPAGILINTVAPGFIETDMTKDLTEEQKAGILGNVPMKRLGRPEEVAAAVAFLASDAASYITGSTIHVNGGMYTN